MAFLEVFPTFLAFGCESWVASCFNRLASVNNAFASAREGGGIGGDNNNIERSLEKSDNDNDNSSSTVFALRLLSNDDTNKKKSIAVVTAQTFIEPTKYIEGSGFGGSGGGGGGAGAIVDDDDVDGDDDNELLNQSGNVPRQPKHAAPVYYTIPIADEETNAAAIKLLNDLAKFQKKLIETEPLKAKAKMRYSVGFKQVLNSVKAGRTILVLLAPDTEVSGALDGKISDLVDEAMANGIPLVYCLNRRKLAKSLDMSMRQSVVGVYKADGTYENFKKIKDYIEKNRTTVL